MSDRNARRLAAKRMDKESERLSITMRRVPEQDWGPHQPNMASVWRSKDFLAQVYLEPGNVVRISVNRTARRLGMWEDGITWDELMRIKRELGYAGLDAVEVYPADRDIVNIANMRHLWIMPEPLAFAWRKA